MQELKMVVFYTFGVGILLIFGVVAWLMAVSPKALVGLLNRFPLFGSRPSFEIFSAKTYESGFRRYELQLAGVVLLIFCLTIAIKLVDLILASPRRIGSQPMTIVAPEHWSMVLISFFMMAIGLGFLLAPLRTLRFLFRKQVFTEEAMSSQDTARGLTMFGTLITIVSFFILKGALLR